MADSRSIGVEAVLMGGRAKARAGAAIDQVVLRLSVVPSAVALAGCGLPGLIDEFGFVGSGGGGRGVPRDAESDASEVRDAESDASEVRDAESRDAVSDDATDAGLDAREETGAVFVEAGVVLEQTGVPVQCPGISVFSVVPAGLGPGERAQLTVATVGPPALVQWSANPASGGEFSNATALAPTFGCTGAGSVTITVVAGPAEGGSCAGVRFTSYSAAIDCEK
jgi:hypothetical protein